MHYEDQGHYEAAMNAQAQAEAEMAAQQAEAEAQAQQDQAKEIPKHHGTIVMGWDSTGALVFARTFDFDSNTQTERDQALAAFDFVSSACHNWVMGAVESVLHSNRFLKEEENRKQKE